MGWADVTTLVVAVGTVTLALVTYTQVRLSRRSLDLSIRPLLADATPHADATENLLFGAPGRISVTVPRGALFYRGDGESTFHISVAFENIGAGVAAIEGGEMDPSIGDVYVSRKFVPVGEVVRVNVAILTSVPGAERFNDFWWAMDRVTVSIRYTDANGKQPLVSRAVIGQAAVKGPWVEEIAVYRDGDGQPLAVGRSSY